MHKWNWKLNWLSYIRLHFKKILHYTRIRATKEVNSKQIYRIACVNRFHHGYNFCPRHAIAKIQCSTTQIKQTHWMNEWMNEWALDSQFKLMQFNSMIYFLMCKCNLLFCSVLFCLQLSLLQAMVGA